MTPPLNLDELEALERAATPGPWEDRGGEVWSRPERLRVVRIEWAGDGPLIAAARNALPALIAELRELRARVAELESHQVRHTQWDRDGEHLHTCERCGYCHLPDSVATIFQCPRCGAIWRPTDGQEG